MEPEIDDDGPVALGGRRLIVVAFLAVQVVVAVLVLVQSRTSVFVLRPVGQAHQVLPAGWQMYARSGTPTAYRATFVDGRVTTVAPGPEAGSIGRNALYDPATAAAVCRRHHDMVRLTWEGEVHRCR